MSKVLLWVPLGNMKLVKLWKLNLTVYLHIFMIWVLIPQVSSQGNSEF